jgi:hypothetical protein
MWALISETRCSMAEGATGEYERRDWLEEERVDRGG